MTPLHHDPTCWPSAFQTNSLTGRCFEQPVQEVVERLEEMVSLAEQFAEEQAAMGNDVSSDIKALAEEFGIKPELVTREFMVPTREGGGRTPAGSTSKPTAPSAPKYQKNPKTGKWEVLVGTP